MSTTQAPATETTLVGRTYTKARRSPSVIGQWPGGGMIPFGPYTVTQVAVMSGSFFVLVLMAWYWAPFGPVPDVALMFTVPVALGYAVRSVQVDGRNPVVAAAGVALLLTVPGSGRLAGRPLPVHRPRRVTGVCTLAGHGPAPEPTDLDDGLLLAPGDDVRSEHVAEHGHGAVTGQVAIGGVQALLARRAAQLAGTRPALDEEDC